MKHSLFALVITSMLAGLAATAAEEPRRPFHLDSDEFPIGMYSIDGPGAMERAESLGIDYVQTYATGKNDSRESLDRDRAYLDLAQKHGRRVFFQFKGRTLADRKDGVEAMLHIIDAVKNHPALGFWVFYDEPVGKHTPEQLLPFYQAAKKAAPDVPFAICHCWKNEIADYKNMADINLNDYYPVHHEPFPENRLERMTQFNALVRGAGLPFMPINQCFNWQAIGRSKNKTVYRDRPVDLMRFPNPAELRFLCYSGLAQGARGIFWWSYSWAVRSDRTWLDKEFAPVNREFRDFTRLVVPAHRGETISTAKSSDILAMRWRRPTGEYWVVVNGRPTERPLTIDLQSKGENAVLASWGATRKVGAAIRDGVLAVESARPWEVFVWQCTKPPGASHQ
jgi:hypothetical protein